MTPIEVLDTSVKIGLGALISGAAAYFLARLNHDREIEKERLRRRRELFEEVAEQVERFTHTVLKFWGVMIGFVRLRTASQPIPQDLLNDIGELRNDLFNVFGEMTSAESKLLLLGEEKCQNLLRDYGEFVTKFKTEASINNEGLTEIRMDECRHTILDKRKTLFNCLSSQYLK